MSEKSKTLPVDPESRDMMSSNIAPLQELPDWVPTAVRLYLAHTEDGRSLRDIARAEGVHASTVLRQVRRFESRRDDPLIDRALGRLRPSQGRQTQSAPQIPVTSSEFSMAMTFRTASAVALPADEAHLMDEVRRLLPLLEPEGVLLVVAADMDKAVILSEAAAGSQRLAVLERPLAEAFALRGWILCRKSGRVAQYELAPEGRTLLRRLGAGRARKEREAMRGKRVAVVVSGGAGTSDGGLEPQHWAPLRGATRDCGRNFQHLGGAPAVSAVVRRGPIYALVAGALV
jgi:hypothetical protein